MIQIVLNAIVITAVNILLFYSCIYYGTEFKTLFGTYYNNSVDLIYNLAYGNRHNVVVCF